MRTDDLHSLPDDIVPPIDDGACDHLPGTLLPSIALASTDGGPIDLSSIKGRIVVYTYPRTGLPDQPPLVEDWNRIPGARGCTPQNCAFRDHARELADLGVGAIFGLSTQDTGYQREMATRLHLPFPVLSDVDLKLTRALRLPTLTVAHHIFLKRMVVIATDAKIEKVLYPVFPPDQSADRAIAWLKQAARV